MITLGIESTAHTLGVGIVKEKKILANCKESYSTKQGGMIPLKVADHHVSVCEKVLQKALQVANISLKQIDLISFSQGPGLGHTLRIGAIMARSLSLLLRKPLVGVNHCVAHLEIGKRETTAKDPIFLYVSGANTQIIAYGSNGYQIFGETIDIGVGNFLDTMGRVLGLGFPSGPLIEGLAKKGGEFIDLPYSVKGMDVSFGGLLTKVKSIKDVYSEKDLCFSVQEIAYAMLVEVSERAMAHCNKKELLLVGGVARNKRLQKMCALMCADRGAKSFVPSDEFLTDNGAMIAWCGYLMFRQGKTIKPKEAKILPYLRTDETVFKHSIL